MTLTNYVSGFPFLLVLFTVLIKENPSSFSILISGPKSTSTRLPWCPVPPAQSLQTRCSSSKALARRVAGRGSCSRAAHVRTIPNQHSTHCNSCMGHTVTGSPSSPDRLKAKERRRRKKTQLLPLLFTIASVPAPPDRRSWVDPNPRTASPDRDQHAVALRCVEQPGGAASINPLVQPPGHTSSRTAQRAPCTPAGRQALASMEQEQSLARASGQLSSRPSRLDARNASASSEQSLAK